MAQTIPFHVSDVNGVSRATIWPGYCTMIHQDGVVRSVIGSDSTSPDEELGQGGRLGLSDQTRVPGFPPRTLMALKGTGTLSIPQECPDQWLSKEYVRLEEILSLPFAPLVRCWLQGSLSEANALLTLLTTADLSQEVWAGAKFPR